MENYEIRSKIILEVPEDWDHDNLQELCNELDYSAKNTMQALRIIDQQDLKFNNLVSTVFAVAETPFYVEYYDFVEEDDVDEHI